mmetsp:Transcript_21972/g.60838  ORF Transcript_21972/g.60838 Transcript_21972/m.60838 type:complete len:290 (+) Transcript_21972:335-1204(+)
MRSGYFRAASSVSSQNSSDSESCCSCWLSTSCSFDMTSLWTLVWVCNRASMRTPSSPTSANTFAALAASTDARGLGSPSLGASPSSRPSIEPRSDAMPSWMLVHIAIMAWASWAPAARNSCRSSCICCRAEVHHFCSARAWLWALSAASSRCLRQETSERRSATTPISFFNSATSSCSFFLVAVRLSKSSAFISSLALRALIPLRASCSDACTLPSCSTAPSSASASNFRFLAALSSSITWRSIVSKARLCSFCKLVCSCCRVACAACSSLWVLCSCASSASWTRRKDT